MGAASGGVGTGPSQDGLADQGYPVNSSCPSTSRALSIPHIWERIFNLAMSPEDISSFCKLRAVGRAWQETGFKVIRNQNMPRFQLPLSRGDGDDRSKTVEFMEKVTPDALLPLVPILSTNDIDVPLASQLAQDYFHIFVGLDLVIDTRYEVLSDLDKKLEVFQGRDLCSLQTVKLRVFAIGDAQLAPAEELQKVLDAIDRLTGGLKKLTKVKVFLGWYFAGKSELILPSHVTQRFLSNHDSLQQHISTFPPIERLARLKIQTVRLTGTLSSNIVERSPNFDELVIWQDQRPLNEAPLPLPQPQLNSLKRITLEGLNYDVETTSGSDVLPNLTTASLTIKLNLEEGEVARLGVLGRLLRNATRFTLQVTTSQTAFSRMEPLSECFSNVTKLEWKAYEVWEELVLPLSHVFLNMTCIQEIYVMSINLRGDQPLDLFRFLNGLQESEIPEEEKAAILIGRRDVVTNLRRLRRLKIENMFSRFQPVSPFLFQATFNSMPELTTVRLVSMGADPFINAQEMVTAWRASGKEVNHSQH